MNNTQHSHYNQSRGQGSAYHQHHGMPMHLPSGGPPQQSVAGPSYANVNAHAQARPSSALPINLPRPPKRRKTPRACDYCREHKLRCDFAHELTTPDGEPICKHCADFGIPCVLASTGERRRVPTGGREDVVSAPTTPSARPAQFSSVEVQSAIAWLRDERELTDPRFSGVSSLSAIVSQFIVMVNGRDKPSDTLQRNRVIDGVQPTGKESFLLLPMTRYPIPEEDDEQKLTDATISNASLRQLVERYVNHIMPLNAIVSEEELYASINLTRDETPIRSLSLMGLAILSVSSIFRDASADDRTALLFHVRKLRASLLRSSIESVQTLILLSQNIELLAPDTNDAAGMSLNLTGLAVRMAQDLGMHRDLSTLNVPPAQSRRMARIWSALVIQDRWYALCYGVPALIHLDECDVQEPSLYADQQLLAHEASTGKQSVRTTFDVHVAHYRIALIIGRANKLIFGIKGLQPSSYPQLKELVKETQEWYANLPPWLQHDARHRTTVAPAAGFLFALKVTADFLLYRACLNLPADEADPFLRRTWSKLVDESYDALEWLNSPAGLPSLHCYSIVMYFMIQCTIIQFYKACKGGSLHGLRLARQSLQDRGTVATQMASRGAIYDPYGPQGNNSTADATGNSRPATAGATAEHAKGQPSSKDDGESPPRLLRLRTKISALVSMFYEVAERQRAAYLDQQDDPRYQGPRKVNVSPPNSNGRGATAQALSNGRPINGTTSFERGSERPATPQGVNGVHPSSPYSVNGMLNRTGDRPPSRSSYASANVHDVLRSVRSAGEEEMASGQSWRSTPAGGSAYAQSSMAPLSTSAHANYSYNHGPQAMAYPMVAGAGDNYPAQAYMDGRRAVPPSQPSPDKLSLDRYSSSLPVGGGGGGGAMVHPPPPLVPLSPPKNVEDLDLVTLQKWADVLLRNPGPLDSSSTQAILPTTAGPQPAPPRAF